MLKCFIFLALFISAASDASSKSYSGQNELTVIGYHEIIDPAQALDPDYATSPENFRQQMAWLQRNQYHFVSIDDILASRRGQKPLPHNAVLLTFDDGYRSVYDNAYPLLKAYHAPAVVALVGSWLVGSEDQTVDFDHKKVSRHEFFTWDQLHEMVNSGLIELGNHTFALHDGILANPQGNMEPAVTTHRYDAEDLRYESESRYQNRISTDLKQNIDLFRQHGFNAPRIMVWPYGSYNGSAAAIAVKLGMPLALTLEDGPNTSSTPLTALRRILLESSTTLAELAADIHSRDSDETDNDLPQKSMYVDLDLIYDPDQVQQEKNLSRLLDRIHGSALNSVYIQAFSRSARTGLANQVYFPNRHLPMRADLFNRVAWQIQSRTQVEHVFAGMPLMAWDFSQLPLLTQRSCRSCINPKAQARRQIIKDLYEDLAKTVNFDGLYFDDPMTLLGTKRMDGKAMAATIPRQIDAINRSTTELASIVRFWQPYLLTAHQPYTLPTSFVPKDIAPELLSDSLKKFDFTVWTVDRNENTPSLDVILNTQNLTPQTIRKLVFELNFDGLLASNKPKIDAFQSQLEKLSPNGVYHIIYDEKPVEPRP